MQTSSLHLSDAQILAKLPYRAAKTFICLQLHQYPYLLRLANMKNEANITDIISAANTENHIPSTPKIRGSASKHAISKIRVRMNEISADVSPSLSAVKNDEAYIEKPDNRNEYEYMEKA